ncbi:hypothetical protein E2562_002994 [Oryza meyeriana var. granulata]|uniref:Legume lectin domain-containing protein n=1 Tax=Oryza meyeriana var. granulata TaxID=110450 RepID=A0A6G1DEC9_9ORYZ|nr:hypothetical protein E2562_002994 [Oryza meyeriana var. granulata]
MAYIGFSSATVLSIAYHSVLGWSFSLNGAAPALNSSKLPTAVKKVSHDSRQGVKEFISEVVSNSAWGAFGTRI